MKWLEETYYRYLVIDCWPIESMSAHTPSQLQLTRDPEQDKQLKMDAH